MSTVKIKRIKLQYTLFLNQTFILKLTNTNHFTTNTVHHHATTLLTRIEIYKDDHLGRERQKKIGNLLQVLRVQI